MNAKKLITAMTMVAMVTLVASADVHHDVTTKVTYFDYSPYTYTYLDDNGVEQTASITDEASPTRLQVRNRLLHSLRRYIPIKQYPVYAMLMPLRTPTATLISARN